MVAGLPESGVQNTSDEIGDMTPAHVLVASAAQVFPSYLSQSTPTPRSLGLKRRSKERKQIELTSWTRLNYQWCKIDKGGKKTR